MTASFDVQTQQGQPTLLVRGSLDINSAPSLAERIDQLLATKPARVVVDLSGLDLIDSSGVAALVKLNYKIMYSVGGPQLCHTLLASGQLHSLYVTNAHRLVGGTDFDTLMWGPAFATPPNLELRSLYLDPVALNGAGQHFAHYLVKG